MYNVVRFYETTKVVITPQACVPPDLPKEAPYKSTLRFLCALTHRLLIEVL